VGQGVGVEDRVDDRGRGVEASFEAAVEMNGSHLGSAEDAEFGYIHLPWVAHNHSACVVLVAVLVAQAALATEKTLSVLARDLSGGAAKSWSAIVQEGVQSRIYLKRPLHAESSRHAHNYLVCTLGPAGPRSPP
jgi:hypothetical protein